MQIIDVKQNSEAWWEARKGKIAGSKLGDIWSARSYVKADLVEALTNAKIEFKKADKTEVLEKLVTPEIRTELLKKAPRKIGFYELLADSLSLERDDEDARERGHRLEPVAREWFAKEYKKEVVEVGICTLDDNDRISNSPDGLIQKGKIYPEAIEIKCLSPARHLQVIVEEELPEEFWTQKHQYFVVNPDLKKLYFIFYNPEVTAKPHYVIEVTRKELGDMPERLLAFQIEQLKQVDSIINELSF